MKKVLFIVPHNIDPRIKKRIRIFINNNYQVYLLYGNRDKKSNNELDLLGINNITWVNFSNSRSTIKRIFNLLLFSKNVCKYIKNIQPDIIYITGFEALIAVCLCSLKNRKKIFYEVPDLPGGRWRRNKIFKKVIDKLEKMLLNNIDRIVLTSPFFIENYKEYKTKIFIFENLPEKRIFANFEKKHHEKFTIGFFGEIRYKKSMETLIEGLGGLNNIDIIIAGKGIYYDEINDIAKKYSNIRMLGSYDYEKDIVYLYSLVDCIYSVYDLISDNVRLALPNKLYEAIICELPIIVSKGTKLEEFVKNKGLGFGISPDNKNELREIINNLISYKEILKDIEGNCRIIKDMYYYENIEKEFIDMCL
ncbi:glycosyltransferase [Thermoanaerobacterium sp. CMT5567-10]|uniref:glycosyltransferase n=1 Tax=Thermoanaerobacterium sp. CMT5567-10 TaxID=3061989 RepID=UPI0026E0C873|nr:glycosyltransferase [Thermoanaerobacterium sp. CMT5567-10]WKV08012.1 glycosyltransferase [Thermoanaerobacterium sp. CMT5567-10]